MFCDRCSGALTSGVRLCGQVTCDGSHAVLATIMPSAAVRWTGWSTSLGIGDRRSELCRSRRVASCFGVLCAFGEKLRMLFIGGVGVEVKRRLAVILGVGAGVVARARTRQEMLGYRLPFLSVHRAPLAVHAKPLKSDPLSPAAVHGEGALGSAAMARLRNWRRRGGGSGEWQLLRIRTVGRRSAEVDGACVLATLAASLEWFVGRLCLGLPGLKGQNSSSER